MRNIQTSIQNFKTIHFMYYVQNPRNLKVSKNGYIRNGDYIYFKSSSVFLAGIVSLQGSNLDIIIMAEHRPNHAADYKIIIPHAEYIKANVYALALAYYKEDLP